MSQAMVNSLLLDCAHSLPAGSLTILINGDAESPCSGKWHVYPESVPHSLRVQETEHSQQKNKMLCSVLDASSLGISVPVAVVQKAT